MIDDNLEEFADPAFYDRKDSSDTGVAFYAALARETGDPVLEIACGTGRVAIPIAREGFAVTGLDVVSGMLELARNKSAGLPVRWVEGDARSFDLGERFRLVFLTGNAFQLFLTNADQEALLGRVRATSTRRDCSPSRRATRAGAAAAKEKRTARDCSSTSKPAQRKRPGLPTSTPADARCASSTREPTTTAPRSCTGPPTGAGTRTDGNVRKPRASRCAIPSRRNSRRC